MSIEEKGDDEDSEEGIGQNELLNPQLLKACESNNTEEAIKLIDCAADPCCEDAKQWSPLIWAASHGNEALTRLLIKHGCADVYKYDESQGKVRKKKSSPLHWAAFKGHLKVLWLLMAPPQNLSHHEKDTIGNTPLHQAAAGGSLECTKCLMAQGVDVFAKNDRGHTPFTLCTSPVVQQLLQRAMREPACEATGKQFSATVLRYMCSSSLRVFCEAAVTKLRVYESPDSTEQEKLVTWSMEVKNTVQEAEQQLSRAKHLNQLDAISAAIELAGDKPVDCQLIHQCRQVKAKLESEIELGESMQACFGILFRQDMASLEEYEPAHVALTQAIDDAIRKNADGSRVNAATMLRRKLMAEAALTRVVEGDQKTTNGHINMLEELTAAAKGESANGELVIKASKLIAKLKSEQEVQGRIAETAPVCAGASEGLPAWCSNTQAFEIFHEDYKKVVELAERNEISQDLLSTALEQLASIELVLVNKKKVETEAHFKDSRKKGKKK